MENNQERNEDHSTPPIKVPPIEEAATQEAATPAQEVTEEQRRLAKSLIEALDIFEIIGTVGKGTLKDVGSEISHIVSTGDITPEQGLSLLAQCTAYASNTQADIRQKLVELFATRLPAEELALAISYIGDPRINQVEQHLSAAAKDLAVLMKQWSKDISKPADDVTMEHKRCDSPISSSLIELLKLLKRKI